MKAFLAAIAVTLVLGWATAQLLERYQKPALEAFSTTSVRLGPDEPRDFTPQQREGTH